MPTALITGITGQDGSYLAELLLSKGYRIVGMSRRTSTLNFERIAHFQDDISLVQGDLHDQSSLVSIPLYQGNVVHILAAGCADSRGDRCWRPAPAGIHPPGQSKDPLLPGVQQ